MLLFLKGFIIGIAKIIPGVSGALLAINFKVYERMLEAVTNFFNNWKNNLKFLLVLGLGIFLAIILFSGVILYLINNYKFLTMMFFIGLIIGGTYNFSKEIKYDYKNIILIMVITILFLILSLNTSNSNYVLKNNFIDNIIFFISGLIEVFSSIVPGISGTAIFMMMGMYNEILKLTAYIFDLSYVISHINIYLSYGIGMMISFIITTSLVNYFIKKYKNMTYSAILGLAIASILFLFVITFKESFTVISFILGIMLFMVGLVIASILDK